MPTGAGGGANEAQQRGAIVNMNESKDQQFNGDGESSKKKKKKKPFDPYRPKKQLSKVWTAFRDTPEGAFCNYCGILRKRNDSSTKSLWEHLKQKHPDVLRALKGESENANISTTNAPPTAAATADIADLQNMATLLQQGNAYDANFNLMASLNTNPAHQLFTGFSLAQNGALTQNTVASASDGHGSVLDFLAGPGMRNAGNVCIGGSGRNVTNRSLLIPQQQVINLVQWRIEPTLLKDSLGIGFIIRGVRVDNNTNYTSSELIKEINHTTYKTTSEVIQVSGPMQCDNKELYRNGFQNWRQYASQQILRMFK